MRMRPWPLALMFFFSVLLCSSAGMGETLKPEASEPIHVEADRMESDQPKDLVRFFGGVLAKQGNLTIRADEMIVTYRGVDQGKAGAAQGIKKITATGNIQITREGWVATGDNLEYFAGQRQVLLTGNAKVWQDNNTVSGERIELFLDEGKSVVEKSNTGERVKAFFYSPDK